MKKYIGTKTVMAMPMAKSEAEKKLNRSFADKAGEDGYIIEYQDRYKSLNATWCQKDTFEQAFKVADTYIDRMSIEYDSLNKRIMKLHTFVMSDKFRELPKNKREKLQAQYCAMSAYAYILGQRLCDEKMQQQHEPQHSEAEQNGKSVCLRENKKWCRKIMIGERSNICVCFNEEQKADNRPVTERIKTFEDACNELGDEHPFVTQYRLTAAAYKGDHMTKDFIAYLKLRIIVAALNEGWEPEFVKEENRYYPLFWLYTKEQYDNLDDEEKQRCVLRSGYNANAQYGLVHVHANDTAYYSSSYYVSRLAFRTRELAVYAGRQFIQEWADFVLIPRSCEGLNGKSDGDKSAVINFSGNE